MTRRDLARRKREIRARRRRFEALSGGWGRPAQEAAWDLTFPRWRACLAAIARVPGEQASAEEISALSQVLTAGAAPRLSSPWYRLLMQTMQRHHDESGMGRSFGRWGGYPIR